MKLLREYLILTILFVVFQPVGYAPRAVAATEPAAPANEPGCVEMGSVGDESLYLCESDYGVRCVWDPSELLSAGVVDCEW